MECMATSLEFLKERYMKEMKYEYDMAILQKNKWVHQCHLLEQIQIKINNCDTLADVKECVSEFDNICKKQ